MSLNVEDGDDARLQLRYEVEKIVDSRAGQYLVKWKHLPLEEGYWRDSADTTDVRRCPGSVVRSGCVGCSGDACGLVANSSVMLADETRASFG